MVGGEREREREREREGGGGVLPRLINPDYVCDKHVVLPFPSHDRNSNLDV